MPDLARLDIARVRAENPGPYTLSGTNTWVVGRDPAWVVDPGPDLADHLDAVAAEVEARGGAGGIAVTHDHLDHVEGVLALRGRYIYGDYCKGRIRSARLTPGRARSPQRTSLTVNSLSSFGEDARGRVYAVSLNGPVYRLVPR